MKSISSSHDEPLPSLWMGALVQHASDDDAWPHQTHPSSRPSNHSSPRPDSTFARARAERLTDGLLAVIFVAGCALMGWAGAAWL